MKFINHLNTSNCIYFVCSGNIIRSAYAELFARHLGIKKVSSFGTRYHNTSIHPSSKQALLDMGVDKALLKKFRPTHFSDILHLPENVIYFVMTEKHLKDLLDHDINQERIYYITELFGIKTEIEDPYFSGNYQEAFTTIEKAILKLYKLLSRNEM